MSNGRPLAILALALFATSAMQPALSQGYNNNPYNNNQNNNQYNQQNNNNNNRNGGGPEADAYRRGYQAGYSAGRANGRFDDTDYNYGYGPPNQPRPDDRAQRWQQSYGRVYTQNDDSYYQECKQTVDPGAAIAGAIIGGLLGNAVGGNGNRAGTTIAGVVVGGALGAVLTRGLDCEDRGYAYKAYSDGFSAGRPNTSYQWRNPRNGNYGDIRIADYYNDGGGFRCANYSQRIYINNRPQTAVGRACQQPDGTWVVVS